MVIPELTRQSETGFELLEICQNKVNLTRVVEYSPANGIEMEAMVGMGLRGWTPGGLTPGVKHKCLEL
jgi:hypothetical protein